MKLSNLITKNTTQKILLNDSQNNKLSNYNNIKETNIKLKSNTNKSIFHINNNFRMEPFRRTLFGTGQDDDFFTTEDVFFESELDGPTIYKHFNNFTINEGHTVTVSNRCKGLVIYVKGDCIINGVLSMSARGCRGVGEIFAPNNLNGVLTKDGMIDLSIGATGGAGAARRYCNMTTNNGYSGSSGINGACGGGGSGRCNCTSGVASRGYSGAGSTGTTWSGGSGSGGISWNNNSSTVRYAGNASGNGGVGGNGLSYRSDSSWANRCAGGGAGNLGGSRGANHGCSSQNGESGTGGLLILVIAGNLTITGTIQSNGMRGGSSGISGGGSSGGGSLTILYKNNIDHNGTIQANGGASQSNGGAGGAGSIRIHQIL